MPKKKKGVQRLTCEGLTLQPNGWVEIQSHLKVKDLPYIAAYDPSGFTKENATVEEQEQALAGTYSALARFVIAWNWKDCDGDPYPKPHGNESIFGELRPKEFNWLLEKVNGVIGGQASLPKQTESASPTS